MTRRSDGSATLWTLLVVLLIWAAAAVGSLEAVAVSVRHRADAAADAAALAAAAEGGLDTSVACAAAQRAAQRVGARLVECTLSGPYAVVTVAVAPPAALAFAGLVAARARAGPADTGSGQSRASRAPS